MTRPITILGQGQELFALDHHDQIVMIGKDHDYHGSRDLYQSQWKGIFVHEVAIYDGQEYIQTLVGY